MEESRNNKTGIYTTEFEGSTEISIGDTLVVMDGSNVHGKHKVTMKEKVPMIEDVELEVFIDNCLEEGLDIYKTINN